MNNQIARYKQELAHFHDSLAIELCQPEDALEKLQHYTQFIDALLKKIWADCHIDKDSYCLIAVGGYGRRELYPYADIDILILTATSVQENKSLEAFLQTLWDLKLKASAITTTYDELITLCKNNLYTLTSILDQHFLAGSSELYHLFCQHGGQLLYLSSEEFYQQKCHEQKERHLRFGQYALSLEPNIKESPGGLRDLQTLLWCWKYAYCKQKNVFAKRQQHVFLSEMHELVEVGLLTEEERLDVYAAYSFLMQSRFTLHVVSGKHQDKLSIEMQTLLTSFYEKQIEDFTLTQRDFMRKYYQCVLTLTYYLQILHKGLVHWLKEKKSLPEFVLPQTLTATAPLSALLQTEYPFSLNDISLEQLRCYYAMRNAKLDFVSAETQTVFLKLFNRSSQVYFLLKNLHIWGLLCHYLPELEFSIGLIQQSLFHSYTVDEHTLLLTAMIDRFYTLEAKEAYPICHEIISTVNSPQVLYLAALLHDSGKGRTEDHSLVGKKLAIQVCDRLKTLLTAEQQDNLVWLVEYHLLMSNVAQKQDIHDPDVIIQFAKQVTNLNRLKLIYLLTVADISATNPNLWNSWKDSLLRKLYLQTEKALECDYALSPINKQVTRKKEKVLDLFKKNHPQSFDATIVTELWQDWPEIYFLHHTVPSITKHTAAILQKKTDAVFYFSDHKRQGHYELFIYCQDRPLLFSLFTNILEKENLSVVSADILTTTQGHVLDSFYLLRNTNYLSHKEYLIQRLEEALQELQQTNALPCLTQRFHKRHAAITTQTEIKWQEQATNNSTLLELITYDRPGLLARIGLVFSKHRISLQQAKIATLGHRVEDIFVIRNTKDHALTEAEMALLEQDLLQALKDA